MGRQSLGNRKLRNSQLAAHNTRSTVCVTIKFSQQLRLIYCCGSRSALILLSWIRIRIGNAVPDPGALNLKALLGTFIRNLVFRPIT